MNVETAALASWAFLPMPAFGLMATALIYLRGWQKASPSGSGTISALATGVLFSGAGCEFTCRSLRLWMPLPLSF